MNYWVSPGGRVWETSRNGGHMDLAYDITHQLYGITDVEDPISLLENNGFIRYSAWGNIGWVIPHGKRPTTKQLDQAFQLTNIILDDDEWMPY